MLSGHFNVSTCTGSIIKERERWKVVCSHNVSASEEVVAATKGLPDNDLSRMRMGSEDIAAQRLSAVID